MAHSIYKAQTAEAKKLRKKAGQYIKSLRLVKDLTQSQLAQRIGIEYYTFISAVENGVNRVPPEGMKDWAMALDVPRAQFAKNLLKFYDPYMFHELFDDHENKDADIGGLFDEQDSKSD